MTEVRVDWSAVTRRTSLAWGFGALAALGTSGTARTTAPRDWSSLEASAGRAIAARLTPGLQLSVMKDGQLVYSRGFGFSNLATETPVTATTMFRIGSLTKQFTAVAMLLLAEDGRLSLDDRLQRFMPDFPRADRISLRQMLTHTSGLAAAPRLNMRNAARRVWDAETYLAAVLNANPLFVFQPGTGFLYSNVAFHLLGWVIKTASGQAYSSFVRTRLFDPIGLAHTAVDDAGAVVPERAAGYAQGVRGEFRNADFISMSLPGAAGSLRSTADDLVRWHAALLAGQVLRPASLEAFLTPGRLNDGALPTGPSRNRASPSRGTIEYGLGIGLRTENGRRLVTHAGAINGFQAELRSYLAERVSVACLINMEGGRAGPDSASGRAMGTMIAEGAGIALG